MTDKQIIIDGVPVQDCCYFDYENDGYEDSCYIHQNECSAQNCYYKQLKRKEQECEELKKDNFALGLRLDELTSPVNVEDCEHSVFNGEYIACRYYEGQRCDDADFANCMFRENVRFKKQLDQLKARNEKLKQTLTEIKEIAKQEIDSKEFMIVQCMLNGSVDNKNKVLKQILQKISECEVK